MIKRRIFAVLIALVILSASASALRTETKEDGTTAYLNDDGTLVASFNPDKMTQLLGTGNWEVDESGFLHLYNTAASGLKRDLGTLSGAIAADPAHLAINVQNGAYTAAASYGDTVMVNDVFFLNPLKIQGLFYINIVDRNRITFDIIDGVYRQQDYFYGCTSDPDCRMSAVMTPELFSLNIKGEGFLSADTEDNENLDAFLHGGYEKLKAKAEEAKTKSSSTITPLYSIKNIDSILMVENNGLFSIETQPQQDAEFNGMKIYSTDYVWITDMTGQMKIFLFQGDDLGVAGSSSFGLAPSTPGSDVHASYDLVSLFDSVDAYFKTGRVVFFTSSDEPAYNLCRDGGDPFNAGCVLIDESAKTATVKARGSRKEGAYQPAKMELIIPNSIDAVNLESFGAAQASLAQDYVKATARGVNTDLSFKNDDIIVSGGGNWFDLGISFKAYLAPESAPPAGQDPLKFYDRFECNYNERKCYLNGVLVSGFTEQRKGYRCGSNTDCGTGRTCKDSLCVTQSACSQIEGYSPSSLASKWEILFVSDEYSREADFDNDVKKAAGIGSFASYRGLFTVIPYANLNFLFSFVKLYGANMPSDFRIAGGYSPAQRYLNSYSKQCPNVDKVIVLSNKNFRPYTDAEGKNIFISSAWLNSQSEGNALVVAHELGHAIANLHDEYYEYNSGAWTATGGAAGVPNCLSKAEALAAWAQWPSILQDAREERWKDCGGTCSSGCAGLLKPTENSIMNEFDDKLHAGYNAFNPPSLKRLAEMIAAGPAGLTLAQVGKVGVQMDNMASAKIAGGCNSDLDCSSVEKCLRNRCIGEDLQCFDARDCPEGEICDSTKQCRTASEILPGAKIGCTTDLDCSSVERCLRRRCVEEDLECIDSEDCTGDEICEKGLCKTAAELLSGKSACSTGRDCETGERCLRSRCIGEDLQCFDSRDCASDEICDSTKQCRTASEILPGAKIGCTTDLDCSSVERCLRRRCVEEDLECIDSEDCTGDEICEKGLCKTAAEILA